jgi:hypothetical protein
MLYGLSRAVSGGSGGGDDGSDGNGDPASRRPAVDAKGSGATNRSADGSRGGSLDGKVFDAPAFAAALVGAVAFDADAVAAFAGADELALHGDRATGDGLALR